MSDRIEEIRTRLYRYANRLAHGSNATVIDDATFLLAELDRLTAELAEARNYCEKVRSSVLEITGATSGTVIEAVMEFSTRVEALREEAEQRADVCHANHEGAIRKLREERDAAIRRFDEALDVLVEVELTCRQMTPGITIEQGDESPHGEESNASWYPRLVEMAIGLHRSALVMIAADLRPDAAADVALGSVVSDVRAVIQERDAAIDCGKNGDAKCGGCQTCRMESAELERVRRIRVEKERDAAIRERDARPNISRADAATVTCVVSCLGEDQLPHVAARIEAALRAHAAGVDAPKPREKRAGYVHATTPPGPRHARVVDVDAPRAYVSCEECGGRTVVRTASGMLWPCETCHGTGRTEAAKGGSDA